MSDPTKHFAAAGAWATVGVAAAGCELATSGSDSPLVQALASTLKVYRARAQERMVAHVAEGVGLTVEAAIQVTPPAGWTPRPKGALRWAEEENRDEWARRVIASIPEPAHITAATLRARQPREADRERLPLP